MKVLLFFLFLFFANFVFAAIPKTSMILQRTAENAGNGCYEIDLEMQFPNGQEPLILKETWMIEDQNNMKVYVSGVKDYKDQVSLFIMVKDGNRIFGPNIRKVSDDFIERYFHMRSSEQFGQILSAQKIIPANALIQRPVKNLKEMDFSPESFVRLARTNGVVAYAFGTPADQSQGDQAFPGVWIEQDQFVVRKLRLASGVEVTADRYSPFARSLFYPRTRTLRWGGQQVLIQTLNVGPRTKQQYQNFGQKIISKPDSLLGLPNANYIDDFYKRFR